MKNSSFLSGTNYENGSGSKFTLIKNVDCKHAEVVTTATITLLQPYLDKTLRLQQTTSKSLRDTEP